jgi:MFS family permease
MYYMTYFTKVQGFTLAKAGAVSSLGSIGSLRGAPLAGVLIGKIGKLKLSLTIGVVVYCALLALSFNITGILIPIWMAAVGIVGMGFVPVVCRTAVPGIMRDPRLMGLGMAIAGFGANLGGMLGPPLFGALVDKAGWNAAADVLIPVALIGLFFAYITKRLSVHSGFCSAALQSSCRAGLQTRTHPIWRLGSRQYSRPADRRYNLRISSKISE